MEKIIKTQYSAVCLLQVTSSHGMMEVVAHKSGQLSIDNYFHPAVYHRRELSKPKQQIILILHTNQVALQLQIRDNVFTLLNKLAL